MHIYIHVCVDLLKRSLIFQFVNTYLKFNNKNWCKLFTFVKLKEWLMYSVHKLYMLWADDSCLHIHLSINSCIFSWKRQIWLFTNCKYSCVPCSCTSSLLFNYCKYSYVPCSCTSSLSFNYCKYSYVKCSCTSNLLFNYSKYSYVLCYCTSSLLFNYCKYSYVLRYCTSSLLFNYCKYSYVLCSCTCGLLFTYLLSEPVHHVKFLYLSVK